MARRGMTPPPGADAGFTLVEVVVSTTLIGLVMAAVTTFFVATVTVTNVSGGQQTAVQLATEGIETARAVPVADLRAAADNPQGRWTPPTPDGSVSDDPEQPVRNDVSFARTWTITTCWQPAAGGSCRAEAAGYLPFLRVVVTATWPDRHCGTAGCSFSTSTLISNEARDPVFTS